MRAKHLSIHNFRSIKDVTIRLQNCSLIAGSNNSGKSNLIDAIRLFYGDIKWDDDRDFPKMPTDDQESWVEIEFQPSESELADLKHEYQSKDGTFRVRKYIKPTKGNDGKPRNGYYAYENEELSSNQFYGSKNVGSGKIGSLIYIPAVSKVDDTTKLSGPSALRDLVATVIKKTLVSSTAYKTLEQAFKQFEENIKHEESSDGHSLARLEREISEQINLWGSSFRLGIQSVQPDDVVKSLITPVLTDDSLGAEVDPTRFGAGFQRHLVYTLIKLAAKYTDDTSEIQARQKKEFSPTFTWILFEEPEAFLHPSQEDVLYDSLLQLVTDSSTQILLTTHSSRFVSRSISDLTRLIRIRRDDGVSTAYQISASELDDILRGAFERDESIIPSDKSENELNEDAEMSAFKTELWMQPQRAAAVFANRVVLVEGPTECALYSYLTSRNHMKIAQGVTVMDCLGKFNLHRFISLFSALGIDHAVLYDGDEGGSNDKNVSRSIDEAKSLFTKKIVRLDGDIESALGIEPIARKYSRRKPQYLLYKISAGEFKNENLASVISLFTELCGGSPDPGEDDHPNNLN